MNFFKKRKQPDPADPVTEKLIAHFTARAARLGLSVERMNVQLALSRAQMQSIADDKVYKLPDRYGDLLIGGMMHGDPACQVFAALELDGGATQEEMCAESRWVH